MQDSYLFSIVIPTCNRPDELSICLDRLAPGKQNRFTDKYEVVVSDDGSMPVDQVLAVRYPWVKWVLGPKRGPASNRNNGAKHARGKWLIFLDDDCIPDSDLLNNYKTAMDQNNTVDVFEGSIYADTAKYSLALTSPVNLTGGYLWSCNFMILRDFFTDLQGFDEKFIYPAMEDVDLRLRINKTKHRILFVREAAVCHPWRKKGGWKKVMEHNISTFTFLEKHPEERQRINAAYYFKFNIRNFLYDTIPGIIKYKGRGMFTALVEHAGFSLMTIKLLFNNNKTQ